MFAVLDNNIDIKGIAHITGGGLLENIPRILPDNCGVKIQKKVWPPPPVFNVMQHIGKVDENEMYRTFNMGIGMVFVVDSSKIHIVKNALNNLADDYEIGTVEKGKKEVGIE